MAASIIAWLCALTGCERKSSSYEDTSHLMRPPPQPPGCGDTPEISDVTLPDGNLANVRILKFLNTKLYIPADWLKKDFVDKGFHPGGFVPRGKLLRFYPDIYEKECSGVVHEFIKERDSPSRETPMISLNLDARVLPSNLSGDGDVLTMSITANETPPGPRLRVAYGGGFHNAKAIPDPDILIFLRLRKDHDRQLVESKSLVDLVEWLKTKPINRDTQRIFTLEVIGK